jgi:hypothetical protein
LSQWDSTAARLECETGRPSYFNIQGKIPEIPGQFRGQYSKLPLLGFGPRFVVTESVKGFPQDPLEKILAQWSAAPFVLAKQCHLFI